MHRPDGGTSGHRPSFWRTAPGILTAIGGLLGASAALITILVTLGVFGSGGETTQDQPRPSLSSARDAAEYLFQAWVQNDRSDALTVADGHVVEELFIVPLSGRGREVLRGCQKENRFYRCTYSRKSGFRAGFHLVIAERPDGEFRVVGVEPFPL